MAVTPKRHLILTPSDILDKRLYCVNSHEGRRPVSRRARPRGPPLSAAWLSSTMPGATSRLASLQPSRRKGSKQMSLPASTVTVERAGASCTVVCGDSREELKAYRGEVDLIVTSPPYADAGRRHYDSVHPDDFAAWFMS